MSLFKRILEVNGKFIPQVYKFPYGWCSRDKRDNYLWTIIEGQILYCSYDTLEEARNGSKTYKVHKA
jgi:hypothetical protein